MANADRLTKIPINNPKEKKPNTNKKRKKGTASSVQAISLTTSGGSPSKSVLRNAIVQKVQGTKKKRLVRVAEPSSNKSSFDSDSS